MLSPFLLPLTTQQEEYSRAFVAAIASTAGYRAERREVDVDGIDIDIGQRSDGRTAPMIDVLQVQAKATYAQAPANDHLAFQLNALTYNQLCLRRLMPRILVVVHMPRSTLDWLTHNPDHIVLRHCAYWIDLQGQPPVTNRTTRTVHIPTTQVFTVGSLRRMMDSLARSGHL